MALVTRLEKSQTPVGSIHRTHLVAHYKSAGQGEARLFQIDTYGSENRQIPGKTSQTLQFSRDSAYQLYQALKAEFGFLD
jgi:hypothetical protein